MAQQTTVTGTVTDLTVPLTDFVDNNGLGTSHLPNVQNINADFGLALAGEGFIDICIDNVRFEEK
jgi:hypothetical protein